MDAAIPDKVGSNICPSIPSKLNDLDVTYYNLQDGDTLRYIGEPVNGWENAPFPNSLSSLNDVNATSPVGGHALIFNSQQQKWVDGPYPYYNLISKPTLNNVTISGDKTSLDYGLFSGNYNDLTNKPSLANVATSGDYDDLINKPSLATVATSGDYNDLTNKPAFTISRKYQRLTLAANTSGYLQLNDILNFPAANSELIGFFAYATLTAATAGTIITAGLIEDGAKPHIHFQTGSVGFTDVGFNFRFCFYTPPTT